MCSLRQAFYWWRTPEQSNSLSAVCGRQTNIHSTGLQTCLLLPNRPQTVGQSGNQGAIQQSKRDNCSDGHHLFWPKIWSHVI